MLPTSVVISQEFSHHHSLVNNSGGGGGDRLVPWRFSCVRIHCSELFPMFPVSSTVPGSYLHGSHRPGCRWHVIVPLGQCHPQPGVLTCSLGITQSLIEMHVPGLLLRPTESVSLGVGAQESAF